MSAKIYYFPHSPEYRAALDEMPAEKRIKLLRLGTLYRRMLESRLKRILASREERKREISSQDTD